MPLTDEEKQRSIAYKQCFATEQGQKVLADLSESCFDKRPTYVDGNSDKGHRRQGMRDVLLYIRLQIEKKLDEPEKPKPKDDNYIKFEGN